MERMRQGALLVSRKQDNWFSIFGAVLCVLSAIVSCDGHLGLSRQLIEKNEICTSKACRDRAQLILSSINESADPCENFYNYVCANEDKKDAVGGGSSSNAIYDAVSDELYDVLADELEHITSDSNVTRSIKKAATFYRACLQSDANEDKEIHAVKKIMDTNGFRLWPVFRDHSEHPKKQFCTIKEVLEMTGIALLFVFHVIEDNINPSSRIMALEHQLPSFSELKVFQQHKPDMYNELLNLAVSLIRPLSSDRERNNFVEDLVSFQVWFEQRMHQYLGENLTEDESDERYTIAEIQQYFFDIPLLYHLNKEFRKVNITLNSTEEVLLHSKHHFVAFMKVIMEAKADDLYNYIGFVRALRYLEATSVRIRAAVAQITAPPGTWSYPVHWIVCISILEKLMPPVISRLYLRRGVTPTKVENVNLLLNFTNLVYNHEFRLKPWMDHATKIEAIKKLKRMKVVIGHDDCLFNDSVLEDKFKYVGDPNESEPFAYSYYKYENNLFLNDHSDLQNFNCYTLTDARAYHSPEAFYRQDTNEIVILYGLIQDVLFKEDFPRYLNLGTFGVLVSRELWRGYNEEGSNFDRDGRKRNWWTNYTREEFDLIKHCFESQYWITVHQDSNDTHDDPVSLASHIADNAALQLAFSTFINSEEYGKDRGLPYLENFTGEQLFFISFAMLSCGSGRPDQSGEVHKHWSRVHNQYRVNFPLQNLPEFSAAFSCKPNSAMRIPSELRCSV